MGIIADAYRIGRRSMAEIRADAAKALPNVDSAIIEKYMQVAYARGLKSAQKEARSEIKNIRARRKAIEAKKAAAEKEVDALANVLVLLEHGKLKVHKNGHPLALLRQKISAATVLVDGDERAVMDDCRNCTWFDFRTFFDGGDDGMQEFGRDLIAEGIAKLPYDVTAFVLPYVVAGEEVPAIVVLEQREKAIVQRACVAYMPRRRPIIFGKSEDVPPEAYYLIAALASRHTHLETIRWDGRAPSTARGRQAHDEYVVVSIRHHQDGDHLGGTHASPRLHWRRGHIRKTKTGKTTWVRAHLVGAAENGVLMKDYTA